MKVEKGFKGLIPSQAGLDLVFELNLEVA